jgi:hypothetical protein
VTLKSLNLFPLLLIPFLLADTSCPNRESHMVIREKAIEIAKGEFVKHGKSVSDYDLSVSPDDSSRSFWMICFDKKGPVRLPGGRHCVKVDKSTGAATFLPGE